ncbi:MAG: DUF4838 domain-containing protein [Bacteroidetes bacterium]|nr:DUF4838 domain-containing protein [Bacteroidota bacterium]
MKQQFTIIIFLLANALTLQSCNAQKLVLASNGNTDYSIVTTGDPKENAGATILSENLKKISGADFNITQNENGNSIFVLSAAAAQKKLSLPASALPGEEGVSIQVTGKNIFIIGGTGNGIKNAVYEFLEKYLGCRYFTADAVFLPQNKNISIADNIHYVYTPVIKYRYVFFGPAFKGDYAGWNKLQNVSGMVKTPPVFGLWVHSMLSLVPPQKYFATHPEYYALRNGKRTKTQLDLTNPDVLRIAKQSLDSIIRKNPQATIFSVSQMDNNGYCECDNCKRKAAETGSQSGVIINFVNQLAAAFPDKIISTLAYNYSRSAPTNIQPAKNVNIMFCASGANHSMPYNAEKTSGSVYSDLNAWSKLTNNIFFWDYLVDFRHLFLPFPNYHALQPNIQLLASNKVYYTFQQGWAYNGSDMPELKTYLLSQLLWNPDIDIKSTQNEFINFYYGDAAPYISKYVNALTAYVQTHTVQLKTGDAPLDHVNDYLSPEQLKIYQQYFADAKNAAAGNEVYLLRVQKAEQSIRYAILDGISKTDTSAANISLYKNMLGEFKNVAGTTGADRVSEGDFPLKDFVTDQVNYQDNKLVRNLASRATAVITNPASYKLSNLNTLFDKVKANKTIDEKWVAFQEKTVELVIDLKKEIKFDSVTATFMHNPAFKVQLPAYLKCAISDDGKNFKDIGVAKNTWAGLGVNEELKTFTIHAPAQTGARYLQLTFTMVNSPNITGDDLPQSMLCDEITVL